MDLMGSCLSCPLRKIAGELARFFDANLTTAQAESIAQLTVEAACEEVLRCKKAEGLSESYLIGLRQTLSRFSRDHPGQDVLTLDVQRVEKWLSKRSEGPAARRSTMGRLASMFSHLERRGAIKDNPMRRLKIPRVPTVQPKILSPSEARSLLDDCRAQCPEILPLIVVGLFAGIRPLEAMDLDWSNVELERGLIRVERTKTHQRRIARLEPVAVAWLRVCDQSQWCPSWSTVRRRRRELRADWPQDVLRHTAASYLLALYQDAGKVAFWLGNSPKILMRHYSEIVGPEECAGFWSISPPATP